MRVQREGQTPGVVTNLGEMSLMCDITKGTKLLPDEAGNDSFA